MKRVATLAMAVLFAAPALAEECLEVGSRVGAFYVKDVTGPAAGEKLCYRCRFGGRPVVSIFAREVNDDLATIVKEIDKQVAQHQDQKMAAFVVLLGDDPAAAEGQLKALAKKHNIKNVPLTIFDGKAGPSTYKISKDADLTVMMWVDGKLKVNDALKKSDISKDKLAGVAQKTKEILN